MKKLLLLLLLTGCSHLNSTVTEVDKSGITRTTKMKAFTFFDAKSELTKFKAGQTDKSQTIGVANLLQETSGSNTVVLVQAVVEAAIRAAMPK